MQNANGVVGIGRKRLIHVHKQRVLLGLKAQNSTQILLQGGDGVGGLHTPVLVLQNRRIAHRLEEYGDFLGWPKKSAIFV